MDSASLLIFPPQYEPDDVNQAIPIYIFVLSLSRSWPSPPEVEADRLAWVLLLPFGSRSLAETTVKVAGHISKALTPPNPRSF
ncbi:hypothetical protein L1987_19031 [Smallanthus sonchifolius]|uniref:Uncharacterized protein n=1 Tax=Smallanthus sonchifolius TaxID=185202 RepID=A0ACB9J3X7_9ASTR|nr:hypothetical protein L1987_19031 [Smallanthus sonchifolius]